MSKLRKIFVASVMFMTVLSMSVVVVPSASAAASAGDLIKTDGVSAVYYLAADGKRYVFPTEQTYFSWYSDFSSVDPISESEMGDYSLGGNVTMRPGTKLVQEVSMETPWTVVSPKVYAVEADGSLVQVTDATVAETLYGSDWESRIIGIPSAYFTNYTDSENMLDGTVYPEGSLIKTADSADIYYIDASGNARKVADEAALTANRLKMDDVITTTLAIPTVGSDITGAESTLTDTSSGAGGTAGAGTGLTVSLSSDTKAAGNIPAGSPNEFLTINLTASNDGDVNVTSIKLNAYDLGTATYIDAVTFYDGGVKVGTAKNVNSDREATFNFSTPINVAAGTTKTLVVKATIEATRSGNFGLGINSTANIVTDGALVSGSFPITGNSQAIVTGVSIGTITMSSVGVTDTSNDFGEDNVLLASFNLAAANEPILWESARLKNGGTNVDDIVTNLRLLVDGDEVATTDGLVGKFVNFDLNNLLIAKNDTISVEIFGDVGIGNVNNTIDLFIDDVNDFSFVGQDFGFGVQIASIAALNAASDGIVVTLTAGDFTIDMDKVAAPAKDVRAGTNGVVLAVLKMTANGENTTISDISDSGSAADDFIISGTGLICNEFDNVILRDTESGATSDVTIASSTTANTCALTMTDEISMIQGVTRTFEIKADLAGSNDTNTIDNNDTLRVTLESGSFNLSGDVSNATPSITPSSVTGAINTVKAASLTWQTTTLTDKTVVPAAQDTVVYEASLEAGASSDVTITSVTIDIISDNGSLNGSFIDSNISQLTLLLDGEVLKAQSNSITEAASDAGEVLFTSLDTAYRVVPAGTTKTLQLVADFASAFATTSTWSLGIESLTTSIVAKDDQNDSVDETLSPSNTTTGSRNVTLASAGTLKVSLLTDDLKADNDTYLLAGSETTQDRYLGEIEFTTTNEDVKLKTLVLGNATSTMTSDDILLVKLFDKDGNKVAEKSPTTDGHVNFDSLDIILPGDQTTSWFIGVVSKGINVLDDPTSTATFNRTVRYAFASSTQLTALSLTTTAVTAEGADSGEAITMAEDSAGGTVTAGEYSNNAVATKYTNITGAILNSISSPMSDGTLAAIGNQTIGEYQFVFANNSNRNADNTELKAELNELILTVATSSGVTVTEVRAHIEGNSSNKTATGVSAATGTATIDLTSLSGTTELVDGTITLVITADVTVTGTGTKSLKTEINSLTTDFTYNGNSGTSTDYADARLDINEVQGATLSNSF